MKYVNQLVAAALAAGLCTSALAQQASTTDNGAQHAQAAAAPKADMTEGEVRKVDKSAGKITLKHGAIKDLDMPPMTMVFGVKESAMLNQVKAGDKIRFRAASAEGKFTLTEIVKAN